MHTGQDVVKLLDTYDVKYLALDVEMASTVSKELWPLHISVAGQVAKGLGIQPIFVSYCYQTGILATLSTAFHGIPPSALEAAPNLEFV